jgi:ABC-type spermidine/putrescine transport system permease subunit II
MDKGAAEAISINLFLPLLLYVVFTAWLFVFLASIIEKSPASFQESPMQTTTTETRLRS